MNIYIIVYICKYICSNSLNIYTSFPYRDVIEEWVTVQRAWMYLEPIFSSDDIILYIYIFYIYVSGSPGVYIYIPIRSVPSLYRDVIEEWVKVQRAWMYLEPIFSSDDIMRQLPTEGKRFANVDRTWRKLMAAASQETDVITFSKTARLLIQLQVRRT